MDDIHHWINDENLDQRNLNKPDLTNPSFSFQNTINLHQLNLPQHTQPTQESFRQNNVDDYLHPAMLSINQCKSAQGEVVPQVHGFKDYDVIKNQQPFMMPDADHSSGIQYESSSNRRSTDRGLLNPHSPNRMGRTAKFPVGSNQSQMSRNASRTSYSEDIPTYKDV